MQFKKIKTLLVVFVLVASGFGSIVYANHSWGGYHWARTSNPFTLELGDNVASSWDGYLATTASDWSISSVLDTVIKPGNTRARTCKATNGRVEVCSEKYGSTGWLGVAQIWVSGSHITKGTVRVNDSYFRTSTYNTSAWKNLVMCQEVGHTLGLDHQDEDFGNSNLNTCMDYTSDPSSNQHPNQHDYDMLESIYEHTDSFSTLISAVSGNTGSKRGRSERVLAQNIDIEDWLVQERNGREPREAKRSVYIDDIGNDERVFTFVTWVQ